MLGELGGFGRALMVFFSTLTAIMTQRFFAAALIAQNYRIQKYLSDFSGNRVTFDSESKN